MSRLGNNFAFKRLYFLNNGFFFYWAYRPMLIKNYTAYIFKRECGPSDSAVIAHGRILKIHIHYIYAVNHNTKAENFLKIC